MSDHYKVGLKEVLGLNPEWERHTDAGLFDEIYAKVKADEMGLADHISEDESKKRLANIEENEARASNAHRTSNPSLYEDEEKLFEIGLNSTPIHAAQAIAKIFDESNKVDIVCEDMDGTISKYPIYKNALARFLAKKGTELRILLRKEMNLASPIYELICLGLNLSETTIDIRRAREGFDDAMISKFKSVKHMTLGDHEHRLEYDLKKKLAQLKQGKDDTLGKFFDEHFKLAEKENVYCKVII